jgi:hypothetical protein
MNKNRIKYEYVTRGVFESLLRDYNSDKNNLEYIKKVTNYIFSNNSYQAIPDNTTYTKYSEIKIKNHLLNNYQEYLDYNILSRLLYEEINMFDLINKNHKDYKQLKELYEFLTI